MLVLNTKPFDGNGKQQLHLRISMMRFLSTDLWNSPNEQKIGSITLQSTNVILSTGLGMQKWMKGAWLNNQMDKHGVIVVVCGSH